MSKLLDKQVNVQKEILKNFQGSQKLPQAHKKCAMKMKQRKKQRLRKNFYGERKDFIRLYQKNGGTGFDELRIIDSSSNEGTNSLLNRRIGRERMVRGA